MSRQRVAELIPANVQGDNQAARLDYVTRVSNLFTNPNVAKSIAVGVALTDTQYADDIAKAVVNLNIATRNNAATIAGAVANVVPAEEACEIATAMGSLIQSGTLKISQASAIASAIANGALVKTTPDELQVVAAQLVVSLMGNYKPVSSLDPNSPTYKTDLATNQSIVNAVAAVAKSVAQVSYKYNVVKTLTDDDHVSGFANQVAGSAMQAVLLKPNLNAATEQPAFALAIMKAVSSVTPTNLGDSAVAFAVNNVLTHQPVSYAVNCLNEAETPVTNY